MKGIVSTYIWSLVTKREFSLDIQYPCKLRKLVEPHEILWNTSIPCYDYQSREKIINSGKKFSISSVFKISNRNFLFSIQYLNLKEFYSNVNLLVMYINHDYIKPMSENKYLRNRLVQLGFEENIERFKMPFIFRTVYNRLFKLTKELQEKFDNFKAKAKPNANDKLFCVQVRIGGARPFVDNDKQFTERENSLLFWEFVRKNLTKNESNYKLFITSDTESVVHEALHEFGNETVVYIDGLYTHIDKEPDLDDNCDRVEKTILDLHAFQLCDKVVISRGGFGLTGNFLRDDPFKDLYRFNEILEESNDRVEEKFIQIKNLEDLEDNENLV